MVCRVSPFRALVGGLVAGAVGALVQSLFFRATSRLAPPQPEGVFTPPEDEQKNETPTATVARRLVRHGLQRELSEEGKMRGARYVHYASGAAWGGLYGIVRESFPVLAGPLGMLGYSTLVFVASDLVILPAFRLSAGARAYPLQNHAYGLAAHVAYGAGLWGAYEAGQRIPWSAAFELAAWRSLAAWGATIGKALRQPGKTLKPAVRAVRKPIARAIHQVHG